MFPRRLITGVIASALVVAVHAAATPRSVARSDPRTLAPPAPPSIAGTWTLAPSSPDGLVQTVDGKPIDGEGAKPGTGVTDGGSLPILPPPLPGPATPRGIVYVPPPPAAIIMDALEAKAESHERSTTFATDALVAEVTTPPQRVTITLDAGSVIIDDETGRTMRFSTTGKEEKHQFINGTVLSKTKWKGAVLHQDFDAGGGLKYAQTWTLDDSGEHLIVAQEAGVDTALHFGLPFVSKKEVAGVAGSASWNYRRADR